MSSAITGGTGATPSVLSHDGAQVVKFDATGISTGAGKRLAQIQTFTTGAVATGTGGFPRTDAIPQSSGGDQYMSLTITPTNAASTLEIDITANAAISAGDFITAALFQDSTVNALSAVIIQPGSAGFTQAINFKHLLVAGTTLATTFKVRLGNNNADTLTFNGTAGGRLLGGVMASRITIKEYLP